MAENIKAMEDALKAIVRLIAVACAPCWLGWARRAAQSYPDKPVRWSWALRPAGPTDVIARIVADKLSANLGKQFYVVNQPGAGSNTATGMVATSPADGYTLLVVSTGLRGQPEPVRQGALRPGEGFRAHHHRRGVAQRGDRAPLGAGQDA